ncbi:MAG: hypothetical protein M3530_11320 [Thermoproteota archaeon]|nr:hypothetical protein [Thermoproteota archaeon]
MLVDLKSELLVMFVAMGLFSQALMITPVQSYIQSQEASDIISTKNSEGFTLSFSASNADRKLPVVYSFVKPIPTNWQLIIQNNLTYSQYSNAKTVVKIQEPSPSEKFIELGMFGGESARFWAAVNTKDSGYIRIYERDNDGWSRDQPIFVAHANNQGLTITNGKRIIIDRLSINDFVVGSISVYGKDRPEDPSNTIGGKISFSIIFGNIADSALYYLPLVMIVIVGGILVTLLVKKKRDA